MFSKELREKGVLKSARKELYREDPRTLYLAPIKRTKDQAIDPVESIRNKSARYILGYTGLYFKTYFYKKIIVF